MSPEQVRRAACAAVLVLGGAYSTSAGDFIRSGDRTVFLGDSITRGGEYGEYVNLFYATRYPGSNRWFSNSGWSGARLPEGILAVDEDVAAKRPSVVTVMYGMNDALSAERWPLDQPDYAARADSVLKTFERNYTNLLALIATKAGEPRIVYVTPSPYDQTCVDGGNRVATRKNDVMGMMAEWVRARARQEGAPCVDLYRSLMEVNMREQAKDPSFSVLRQGTNATGKLDRVHPGPLGHMLFLDAFLRAFEAPGTVDEIAWSAGGRPCCEFTCTERALPFPADTNMSRAYALCPFVEDFNREILRVGDLPSGFYRVTVDGKEIGRWDAAALGAGVNIATNAATPQFAQALKVMEVNAKLWKLQATMRVYVTCRRWLRIHHKIDPDDFETVRKMREKCKGDKRMAYAHWSYGLYLDHWPKYDQEQAEAERLREEVRKAAQPVPHRFAVAPCSPSFVTYEAFGAKGDGKTDDMPAIVAAHRAANEKGLPVRAKDGATYYIGGQDLTAEIRTDTDFGTSKLVFDDRNVVRPQSFVFSILPTARSYPIKGVSCLRKGMKSLGIALPGRALVKFENAKKLVYRRTGDANAANNGQPQQMLLIVGKDGSIDESTDVWQDMDAVTRAEAFPIDEKTLTVSGGTVVTIANREVVPEFGRYAIYKRGINIARSNVLVTGLKHEIVDEIDHIAPYRGIIYMKDTADVTVSNCLFVAHRKSYKHGSYDLSVWECVNARFVGCRESTDLHDNTTWPTFGSNNCRNLLFDGCEFRRFDAHTGTHNATVRNSRLFTIAAIGTGTFLVENTQVEGYEFCRLRWDYGSNWDGDFVIRNCVYKPHVDHARGSLINVKNSGSHDYGYQCRMGRRIVVDGLQVDDLRGGHPFHFTMFVKVPDNGAGSRPASFAYLPPEEICLRNITLSSGKRPTLTNDEAFFRSVRFTGDAEVIR